MHTATISWTIALLLAATTPVIAQSANDAATHPPPHTGLVKEDPAALIPAAARPAIDIVDAFGKALASGDLKQVETLLEPTAVILESGGAERSRAEYMGHHAKEDAKFLGSAHVSLIRRVAGTDGGIVWVASESEIHSSSKGKPVTLLSAETMLLIHGDSGWRIAHIHWSSRPKNNQ